MILDFATRFDAVLPSTPREAVSAALDAAARDVDAALAAFREDAFRADAFAGPCDPTAGLGARIAALLALESNAIPASAVAADAAVDRFTTTVGFRKRDLMPRFLALADHVRAVHRHALAVARDARWTLMERRALADPGVPSSPIHGTGTRYVKSDRFDARAAASLPPDDRVRADRFLKRLGEAPVPAELDLRPADGPDGALWTMKAGNANRFILRRGEAKGTACFFVEDVGPYPDYGGWTARR